MGLSWPRRDRFRAESTAGALALPAGTRWSLAGQGDEQASSFRQLGIGLGMSILLMYMVLAILYESWIQPVLILTALPLASVVTFALPRYVRASPKPLASAAMSE